MRPHILLILTSVLLSIPFNLNAQYYPSGPAYSAQAAPQQNPGILLREGIEKLLAYVEGGGAEDRDKLVAFVDRDLADYFDFVAMTRWSLGPRGQYMNNDQRREAVLKLRGMFLSALVDNLMHYEPGRIQYLPPRGNPYSNEMMLSVQSFPTQGYPMRLDFYFYRGGNGWKVMDVAANGLRATTVYREYFNPSGPYARQGYPPYGQ
jgi:ABC-type transporter MlaC component